MKAFASVFLHSRLYHIYSFALCSHSSIILIAIWGSTVEEYICFIHSTVDGHGDCFWAITHSDMKTLFDTSPDEHAWTYMELSG